MFKLFKKRKIVITNKEEFVQNLSDILDILKANNFNGQVIVVEEARNDLLKDDNQKFLKSINSVDFWGGSGAVWEVGDFDNKIEESKFQRQIIQLTDLMKQIGIRNRGAYSVAKLFRSLMQTQKNS